jgi:hypothetical protein
MARAWTLAAIVTLGCSALGCASNQPATAPAPAHGPDGDPRNVVTLVVDADARTGQLTHIRGYVDHTATYDTTELESNVTGTYKVTTTHTITWQTPDRELVCLLPCKATVPSGVYQVVGNTIPGSPEFQLTGPGTEHLTVQTGSSMGFQLAWVGTVLGATAVIVGGMALGFAAFSPVSADYTAQQHTNSWLVGGIGVPIGAVLLYFGLRALPGTLTKVRDDKGTVLSFW